MTILVEPGRHTADYPELLPLVAVFYYMQLGNRNYRGEARQR